MENTIDFFGKTAKLNTFTNTYDIKITSKDDVCDYYDLIKKECYLTNFGLNPFEANSFGEFEIEGNKYRISAPRQSNGDDKWYKYADVSKRVVEIIKLN
jgi:hypothetical protein